MQPQLAAIACKAQLLFCWDTADFPPSLHNMPNHIDEGNAPWKILLHETNLVFHTFRCGMTISYNGMKPIMAALACFGYHLTKCGNQTLCYLTSKSFFFFVGQSDQVLTTWSHTQLRPLVLVKCTLYYAYFCSADGNYEVRYKSNVLIYPDGEVLWVPPAIYQVSCRIHFLFCSTSSIWEVCTTNTKCLG